MPPQPADIAVTCAFFVCTGVEFGFIAWFTLRRSGRGALAIVWVLASTLLAGLMTMRIHEQQTALGFSQAQQQQAPVFFVFLPMWGMAFAATGFSRRTTTGYGLRPALKLLAAYLAGAVLFLVIYLGLDIAGLLHSVYTVPPREHRGLTTTPRATLDRQALFPATAPRTTTPS